MLTSADSPGVDVEEGGIEEQAVLEAWEFLGLVADYPALSRAKPARRRGILLHSQRPEGTRHKSCL
jgi:hypothetical protein